MATPSRTELLTLDEFFALPDPEDGSRLELIDGEVFVVPPPGWEHGVLTGRVLYRLREFAERQSLGEIVANSGFVLSRTADSAVEPDVAFHLAAPSGEAARRAVEGAPTLAVEIVSPSDRLADVRRKVERYLQAGSERVWVVNPRRQDVTVYRPAADPVVHAGGATLTSDDAGFEVEGLSLPLDYLFR